MIFNALRKPFHYSHSSSAVILDQSELLIKTAARVAELLSHVRGQRRIDVAQPHVMWSHLLCEVVVSRS